MIVAPVEDKLNEAINSFCVRVGAYHFDRNSRLAWTHSMCAALNPSGAEKKRGNEGKKVGWK